MTNTVKKKKCRPCISVGILLFLKKQWSDMEFFLSQFNNFNKYSALLTTWLMKRIKISMNGEKHMDKKYC